MGWQKHTVDLLNELSTDRFELSIGFFKESPILLSRIRHQRLRGLLNCKVATNFDSKAVKSVAAYIDDKNIDSVVSTSLYSLAYGVLAQRLSKKRPDMISVFHSIGPLSWIEELKMHVGRPLLRRQSKLVYVCDEQYRYWQQNGLPTLGSVVIHNGVDTERFNDVWTTKQKTELRRKFNIDDSDYLIGICACLRPEKSHGDLLKAIKRLIDRGTPAKCLIIGDGVERGKIENQIKKLKLDSAAFITGYQEDVRRFVAACDVMTLVSKRETFSIAALEAMSLRKPLVMSDVGGAKEQVKPSYNGHLFNSGDIEGLTSALSDLDELEKRTIFGERSRELVKANFSLQQMVGRFEELLT